MGTDPAWRRIKMQSLCDERHPILTRMRLGRALRTDEALLRHIHRELDFYGMQEAKPGLDAMRDRNRRAQNLIRRMNRLLVAAGEPPITPRTP